MPVATRFIPPLLLLLGIASGGCGILAGPSPTPTSTPTLTPTSTPSPTPTPTPTPTLTPTPTPSPTPTPPSQVQTPSMQVAQGGVGVLRVRTSAASAVATVHGQEFPLITKPDGFWGVIPVAADHATGIEPVRIVLRNEAGQTVAELSATVVVVDTAYSVEQIRLSPERSVLLDPALAEQERAVRAAVFAAFTPEQLWSGAFLFPVSEVINSPYGVGRSYNGGPVGSFHGGADFPIPKETPVVAANAGRVAFAGTLPLRGVSVIIEHGAGVFSGYHHLASATVLEGQAVAKGDLIGYSGDSGLSTGPHLHWEVIVRGVEVDPVLWTEGEIGP